MIDNLSLIYTRRSWPTTPFKRSCSIILPSACARLPAMRLPSTTHAAMLAMLLLPAVARAAPAGTQVRQEGRCDAMEKFTLFAPATPTCLGALGNVSAWTRTVTVASLEGCLHACQGMGTPACTGDSSAAPPQMLPSTSPYLLPSSAQACLAIIMRRDSLPQRRGAAPIGSTSDNAR